MLLLFVETISPREINSSNYLHERETERGRERFLLDHLTTWDIMDEISFCWKNISVSTKPGLVGRKPKLILDNGWLVRFLN